MDQAYTALFCDDIPKFHESLCDNIDLQDDINEAIEDAYYRDVGIPNTPLNKFIQLIHEIDNVINFYKYNNLKALNEFKSNILEYIQSWDILLLEFQGDKLVINYNLIENTKYCMLIYMAIENCWGLYARDPNIPQYPSVWGIIPVSPQIKYINDFDRFYNIISEVPYNLSLSEKYDYFRERDNKIYPRVNRDDSNINCRSQTYYNFIDQYTLHSSYNDIYLNTYNDLQFII